MYPFSLSLNPALRPHLDAQTAFLNDVSKSMFSSFQQVCDLNIQLVQTLLEEAAHAGQHLLTAEHQTELLGAAAARAQPTTDKLRAYQQHIARVTADAQVALTRVAEQHLPNTSRTARKLADEVSRSASEETAKGLREQQEVARSFIDPFGKHNGDARAHADTAEPDQRGDGARQHDDDAGQIDARTARSGNTGAGRAGQHVN